MKLFLILYCFCITSIDAKNIPIDLNQGFPNSLLGINSPYILFQLPDDKLYLVNTKYNHKGCLKVMQKINYEWNIEKRKYIKPVDKADEGISENNLKKLKFILLTDTPLTKNTDIKKSLNEKRENGELYCEALRANFK